MSASPRIVLASVLIAGLLGAAPISAWSADAPSGRLYMVDGKPAFHPPTDWTQVSQRIEGGKRYTEYRFPLKGASGQFAVARVSLEPLARSVRFADLPADEARALEQASDEAIQDTMRQVESMPGMEFEAGGAQLIYTALDGAKRYHYIQFISVKGVVQQGSELAPAVAIGLRCRSAVDEASPQRIAAAEELESRCYDVLAGMGTIEGGTVSGAGGGDDSQ